MLKKEEIASLTNEDLLEHIRMSEINSDEYAETVLALHEEKERRNPTNNYSCMKCNHDKFDIRQLRASGGFASSFFGVQTDRYTAIVCQRCAFTEFYYGEASIGAQTVDFLFGS